MIGKDLSAEGAEIIDAKGAYIFPGGIDPHTHLDMPFGGTTTKDDYETGTIGWRIWRYDYGHRLLFDRKRGAIKEIYRNVARKGK